MEVEESLNPEDAGTYWWRSFWELGKPKMWTLVQVRKKTEAQPRQGGKKEQGLPSSALCSGQDLSWPDDACGTGEGELLSWVHWFKCWSHLGTSSQTHPEITFNHISRHPATQSNWCRKSTITRSYFICRVYLRNEICQWDEWKLFAQSLTRIR